MAHYNKTIQGEVTSNRDFAEKLKRKGAEYTERTGIETNYQPIEPGDIRHHVTNEGMDSTNRVRVSRGQKELNF